MEGLVTLRVTGRQTHSRLLDPEVSIDAGISRRPSEVLVFPVGYVLFSPTVTILLGQTEVNDVQLIRETARRNSVSYGCTYKCLITRTHCNVITLWKFTSRVHIMELNPLTMHSEVELQENCIHTYTNHLLWLPKELQTYMCTYYAMSIHTQYMRVP